MQIPQDKKKYLIYYNMKSRDSKGRFIKTTKGGRKRDSKGRFIK